MPVQIFKLRDVPDDEAADVRALLSENDIEFYETTAGSWGISAPGIWLKDESRFAEARALIDAYQLERQRRMQEEYAQLKRQGRQRSVAQLIMENPLRAILYLVGIAVILYISIKPFLHFGQ